MKPQYDKNIEIYRGLCAFFVVLTHVTNHDILIGNLKFNEYVRYLGSGYLSVLVFFCISGYVIGITTYNHNLNIGTYLKKRAIRLYPIYLIAIILCIFISFSLPFKQVIGNLLFLQNSSSYIKYNIPVFVNFPAWSLNYEAIYYLLFVPIFFLRPKIWMLLLTMILISFIFKNTSPSFAFLLNYINGLYFWILGLIIGWNIKAKKKINIPLLSLLFLHLSQDHLGLGMMILNTLKINTTNNLNWIFDLPFCLMILMELTGQKNILLKTNKYICYATPCIIFIYLLINQRLFENERWIMCLIFWSLSILFLKERIISSFLSKQLLFLGKISYGLYLFHIPVALIIKQYIFIENRNTEIMVKYGLWFSVLFLVSYLTENILQPKIRSFFLKDEKTHLPILPETSPIRPLV